MKLYEILFRSGNVAVVEAEELTFTEEQAVGLRRVTVRWGASTRRWAFVDVSQVEAVLESPVSGEMAGRMAGHAEHE